MEKIHEGGERQAPDMESFGSHPRIRLDPHTQCGEFAESGAFRISRTRKTTLRIRKTKYCEYKRDRD